MTIRKRLFWSNILMIIIPAVLSSIIAYLILFIFTRGSTVPMERAFPLAYDAIVSFERTRDMGKLQDSIDEFNSIFEDEAVLMAVIRNDHFVYPEGTEGMVPDGNPLLDQLIASGATGSVVCGDTMMIVEKVGDYRIMMLDMEYHPEPNPFRKPLLVHIPIIFIILIVVILFTNRILTHILTKRITDPLGKLAKGARELGDGNLDYRIHYVGKDEFSPVCRDFNEMAEHLQRLIEYQQKNENSRKELLAGISHDLRTPLTSIKAYVEGLLDGVAEDYPAQLRYLGIIRNKAEDIDRLVDKLFLFSKLDIGEYPVNIERVDIGGVLSGLERTVDEEYREKGLRLVVEERPQGLYVDTDLVHLHSVFINILENSMRYRVKDTCTVTVSCVPDNGQVVISLTDDGPGVQEKDLQKIFEVFYRGDPSRQNPSKGSGLGLAISARMMSLIGGSIHAQNAPGGGLRTILRLPRCQGEHKK